MQCPCGSCQSKSGWSIMLAWKFTRNTVNTMTILFVYSMLFSFSYSAAQFCSSGTQVGNVNFKKEREILDETSGVMFLMVSPMYRYTCCGLIKQFKSYGLVDGDIHYLVWRPVDDQGKYRMVGTFSTTLVDTPRASSVLPSGSAQSQVKDGDVLGWFSPNASTVPYVASEESGVTGYMMTSDIRPELGDVVDWTPAQPIEQRKYAIATALIGSDEPPVFKNMKESVSIGMQLEVGGVVMNIPVVDPQYKDTELVVSPDTHFTINNDKALAVGSPLVPDVYELQITATDICGLVSSASVTVTVTEKAPDPTTAPPETPETAANTNAPDDVTTKTQPTLPDIDSTDSLTSENHTAMTEEDDDGWKYGVGVTAFVLLFVIIGLSLLWLWRKKRKERKTKPNEEDKEKNEEQPSDGEPSKPSQKTDNSP